MCPKLVFSTSARKLTKASYEILAFFFTTKFFLLRNQCSKRPIRSFICGRYVPEGLTLGQLSGNQFAITLRSVPLESQEHAVAAAEALQRHGFVNYFGLQVTPQPRPLQVFKEVSRGFHCCDMLLCASEQPCFLRCRSGKCALDWKERPAEVSFYGFTRECRNWGGLTALQVLSFHTEKDSRE
jgi:hypothetical protein